MPPPWTYSFNPAASVRDEIRFLIGDTDQTRPWTLYDGEIDYNIGLYSTTPLTIGNNFRAAAESADAIVAKLVRLMSLTKSVGDLHLSVNPQILTLFQNTAKRLHDLDTLRNVTPYFGGISISDKQSVYEDTDRPHLAAEVNGMDLLGPDSGNNTRGNQGP